jgi:hypothetical protein
MPDDADTLYDAINENDPQDVEYMFAQTAANVAIDGDNRITLTGVGETTLWFSDRPDRLVGHIPTSEFVASWSKGDDNFSEDPPNALLSSFEDESVNDVVLILSDPKLNNGDLSYAAEVTEGDLASSTGPASLFIDQIGRPMTAMSVAGVRRRGRRRGRRRMAR